MIDQKKGLLGLTFLLFLSSFIYLTHLYSSHSNTTTSQVTDSSYLINEQTFFDTSINSTSTNNITTYTPTNNQNDPLLACNCNELLTSTTQSNNEILPPTDEEELPKQEIEIPESLPEAPKELMDKINDNLLEDRVLIIATANYGMRNHVYNWIESLKRTREEKFLIFCFDNKLYQHLKLNGYENRASLIPEIWFHQQVESDFKTYFSQEYRIITHSKTLVVQQLLYLNINVLFSDVDIVWLRPRMVEYVNTFLQIRPETHVLFQQEGLNQQEVNSGFYLMRPTIEMKKLLAETIYIQDTVDGKTQQGSMNQALDNLNMDLRTTSVVLLDVLHFPNGYVYFDQDLPNKHGINPFMIHANYLVSLFACVEKSVI
jgi:hypothetical protein